MTAVQSNQAQCLQAMLVQTDSQRLYHITTSHCLGGCAGTKQQCHEGGQLPVYPGVPTLDLGRESLACLEYPKSHIFTRGRLLLSSSVFSCDTTGR